jgi:TRAP-type mannitol/chloroaromatic compound transport system substrate-binding protein
MTEAKQPAPRRRFLKSATAGAVGAGAMAVPMISSAQTVAFRFQSTWPAKDIFHEYANDFAKKVNDMAGGRLKIPLRQEQRAGPVGQRPGLWHGPQHGPGLALLRWRQGDP